MKNCLNCKYEPDWGEWTGREYKRTFGECRYEVELPDLPSVYTLTFRKVERYRDDSGIPKGCKTFEAKEEP